MALLLKVKWVEQSEHPDPSLRIQQIGGTAGRLQWNHTHAQAVQFLEQGLYLYYVEKNARALHLEIGHSADGCKFLKTTADSKHSQFLLNLPKSSNPPPL